jgi:hypothetical protein
VEAAQPWSFDRDGPLFRLVSVHTSMVEPLPHRITAVYECMLPRQPPRFLLADDPGAGKTIMAGLLINELIARGDLQRRLVVCPGSLAEQWRTNCTAASKVWDVHDIVRHHGADTGPRHGHVGDLNLFHNQGYGVGWRLRSRRRARTLNLPCRRATDTCCSTDTSNNDAPIHGLDPLVGRFVALMSVSPSDRCPGPNRLLAASKSPWGMRSTTVRWTASVWAACQWRRAKLVRRRIQSADGRGPGGHQCGVFTGTCEGCTSP